MLIAVLLGFLVSLAAPLVFRVAKGATGWVLALLPLGLFAYFARQVPAVMHDEAVRFVYPWMPSFGVNLTFYLDGLSMLFALLITGIGALIVIYSQGYLHGHAQQDRFFLYLLLFMSSMLGLVLADNLITLFVFWELTSITSFLLIGFYHEEEYARESARQALLVTGGGGLAFLAGLILLSIAGGGTFELSEIIAQGDAVREHALYVPIFILVVIGCFTKSAQFPFHFWLPNAMAGPTPVSAYLHSATMVKAGVYFLARTDVLLGDTLLWTATLASVGSLTAVMGAVLALRETDLKRILAYSTIMALGLLVALLGLSFKESLKAAIVFLVVHSLYKGALFMTAGAVDHEAGTRDVLRLGGLRRSMPITAGATVLAALSMAGLPPFFGFIGKEVIYEAKLAFPYADVMLPAAAVAANALTVTAAGILAIRPFFGAKTEAAGHAHEAPVSMWLGPVVLSVTGLAFGILPGMLAEPLVVPAVLATLGQEEEIYLALWHGLNTALALSVVTVLVGVAAYLGWARVRGTLQKADPLLQRGPEYGYWRVLDGLNWTAETQTRLIQNGYLRFYLFATLAVTVGLAGTTLLLKVEGIGSAFRWPDVLYYEWMLGGLVSFGALATILIRSRLAAITTLGISGFSVALLFTVLGAPDLATTQFLTETLIVIILLLVVRHLPPLALSERVGLRGRLRDAVLALGVGALMTTLVFFITSLPFDRSVSEYFARNAVPEGLGHNIVNVILVDFRALDTMGEIVVLATAALGAYALVKLRSQLPVPMDQVVEPPLPAEEEAKEPV